MSTVAAITPLAALDTPALVLRRSALEANVRRMAALARMRGVALRPHLKTHKCPTIARLQRQAGVSGFACQTLGEAEIMAAARIEGLLVCTPAITTRKIDRLVHLARGTAVAVVADSAANVAQLAAAADAARTPLDVVVEVDVGMGRCGADPGEGTWTVVRAITDAPPLRFAGLMGYEGHAMFVPDREERRAHATSALRLLVETAAFVRDRGVAVPMVSAGGTGTVEFAAAFPGVTEIQPGSYATMDGRYSALGVPFEPALTVVATVISGPRNGIVVADAGLKSLSTDFGLPRMFGHPEWEVKSLSEEHAKIAAPDGALRPGDRVELLPMHGCTTINLHDRLTVLADDGTLETWAVAARGRSQ